MCLMAGALLDDIRIIHLDSDIEEIIAAEHPHVSFFVQFGTEFFSPFTDPAEFPDIGF